MHAFFHVDDSFEWYTGGELVHAFFHMEDSFEWYTGGGCFWPDPAADEACFVMGHACNILILNK